MVRHLTRYLKGDGLRAELLRGAGGIGALMTIRALLTFVTALALARMLGPAGYGDYAFAFSVVGLLNLPTTAGLPQLVVREVAKYHASGQWGLMRGLLLRANLGVLAFSVVVVAVAATAVLTLEPGTRRDTLLVALLLVPLAGLDNLHSMTLRGLRHVVLGQLPQQLIGPAAFLALLGGAWFAGGLDAPRGAGLHLVSVALTFVVGAWILAHKLPTEVRGTPPEYATREWLRALPPFTFLAGAGLILSQTDIVMLGLLAGSTETGIYRVATQIALLVIFAQAIVGQAMLPHVPRLHALEDTARLQRMLSIAAGGTLLATLAGTIGFVLLGEPFLALAFGPDYEAAWLAGVILCLGQVVSAGCGSVQLLMNMTGHERVTAIAVGIAAIANVALNALLIPPFGIEGAAIATATTTVGWNLALNRYAHRHLGIHVSPFQRKWMRQSHRRQSP